MRGLVVLLFLLWPVRAVAQDFSALKQPGAVALMRHALAPGTGDPAGFTLDDCATQRNLDAAGRAQARRIGALMRGAGVTLDAVWTSQWCRTRDTAELTGMGTPLDMPMLNSFFAGQGDEAAQTRATLEALRALPEDARVLLVTHQVNITALTGVFPGSGEIVVARRSGDGLRVVDRIRIAP